MAAYAQYAPNYRPSAEQPDFPNMEHVEYLQKMGLITGLSGVAAVGVGTYFFLSSVFSVEPGERFNPLELKSLLGMGFLAAGIGGVVGSFVLFEKSYDEANMIRLRERGWPTSGRLSMGMTDIGVGLTFCF